MGASIFVLEETPIVRCVLVKRLARHQHRVLAFESCDALAERLRLEHPDLIVFGVPGLTARAFETLDVLYRETHRKTPHIPIIVLVAHATVEEAVNGMKHGATDVLLKTIELENVEVVITRALEDLRIRQDSVLLQDESPGIVLRKEWKNKEEP